MEDFDSCEDVYDAIGDILQSVDIKKTENSIRDLCGQFYEMMKINAKPRIKNISGQKMLNAPINISELIRDMEEKEKSMQSIWVMNKENVINVSKMCAYINFVSVLIILQTVQTFLCFLQLESWYQKTRKSRSQITNETRKEG